MRDASTGEHQHERGEHERKQHEHRRDVGQLAAHEAAPARRLEHDIEGAPRGFEVAGTPIESRHDC